MERYFCGRNPDAVLLGKLPTVKKEERQPRIRQELDKSRVQQKHFYLSQHFQPTPQGTPTQQGPISMYNFHQPFYRFFPEHNTFLEQYINCDHLQ